MKKLLLLVCLIALNCEILYGQEDSAKIILSEYLNFVGNWDDVKTLTIKNDEIDSIGQTYTNNSIYYSLYPYAFRVERITNKSLRIIGVNRKNFWVLENDVLKEHENNFPINFSIESDWLNPLSIKSMLQAGRKFQYLGKELYKRVLCYKVSADLPDGFKQFYYFSVADFSLVMGLRQKKAKSFYVKMEYYQYKRLNEGKYCVPHKWIEFSNTNPNKPVQSVLKEIVFNPTFEDNFFSAPKK